MIKISRIIRKYVKNSKFLTQEIVSKRRCTFSTDSTLDTKKEKSLSLYRSLYSRILACGPITVADYMKEILTHPNVGYYTSNDVFGVKGDFITSPEITQLFGELIAVWIIHEWNKITNGPAQIVELGPGRGTLMKDLLRVFKNLRLTSKVSIHLVEISPTLSSIQAKNLCITTEECTPEVLEDQANSVGCYRKGVTEDGVNVYWYYSVKDVPKEFTVFLAHEFFDALPIHIFERTDKGWNEVLVDVIEGINEEKFRFVLSSAPTAASTVYIPTNEKRDHIEVSPESIVTVDYMSKFLWECGGFALICDYGHNGEKTDTFRAFLNHKLHDPLSNPGMADLTADVDFSAIKRIAEKDDRLLTFGPVTQRSFLKNLGIDVRLGKLLLTASKEERKQLESGYRMIMDADKMGVCFKVLSLFPSVLREYLKKVPLIGFNEQKEG